MRKKICFLVDSLFTVGGVQRVTAVIAKAMTEHYDVTIVTLDPPELKDTTFYGLSDAPITYRFFRYPPVLWWKRLFCKAYSACYRKLRLPGRRASDLYARSSFPWEQRDALSRELIHDVYDVVIGVHAPLAVRLASVRHMILGTKTVGWIHNSFEALYGAGSPYIGPELKRHYVYQLRKLHETVVLSHHDAQAYHSYDPCFTPRVIFNPLTLNPKKPSDGTSKQFLAVGRFTPRHKGFDLLIDAFHIFAQKNADWTLHIVGEGLEEKLYRQKISDYQLEHRITIHPFTHDIQSYYSQAQVYVLSSRWEGFGLVIVEAMAHGLPVVSSDLPTSLEIMGDAGIYFANGNVAELADCLLKATHLDWPSKSAEALAVASRFDISSITRQWKEIIDALSKPYLLSQL